MSNHKSWDEISFQIVINLFLIVVFLVVAIPLWRVLMVSLTPLGEKAKAFGLLLAPAQWTLEAYQQLLSHPTFLRAMSNSIFITLSGTALNLVLTVPLAYALSCRALPGRKFFIAFVLFPMLFHAGLVPTYLVVTRLKLQEWGFAPIIVPVAINIYNLLVMKSFFEGLPEELKEAARIDGASELQILLQVVLPLSKPILLTIGLFYAVSHWNEFFTPILYLNDPKLIPLPVLLRNILMAANFNEYVEYNAFSSTSIESLKAAGVFLTMLPMMIIYPWIQRHFTKGVLLGGVKE